LTHPGQSAAGTNPSAQQDLKERALADLTEFAKQSLVQGLYSQRKALLEERQKAQQELAALEGRLVALHLPDRIQAYEKRIAELEKQLESRSDEVRELTNATLLLLRQKLEEERQLERKARRFQ
jgi:isocitrate dehydrogenase kinase/phosphatase